MKVGPAYFTWDHPYGFRAGESGLIVGIVWLRPDGSGTGDPRACFMISHPDGFVDHAPLSDANNFTISGEPREVVKT